MQLSRRTFLKIGGTAAGGTLAAGGAWVGVSSSRRARMLRQLMRDTLRTPVPSPVAPRPMEWPDNQVTVAWLGHATVLINFYGLRLLTDPVFSIRVGLNAFLGTIGPKRYVAPALAFGQLPRIDLVLLSHAHYDHLDLPSLARFPKTTAVITAHDTADLLCPLAFTAVTELAWGEGTTFRCGRGDVRIEAFEVRHWGARWPSRQPRGYNGYLLRRDGRALLFGGDTAYLPSFRDLRARGPFAAALMPIASYNPWIHSHCTPEEALKMANEAGAERLVPIHHSTFKLSDEPMTEPLERLEQALAAEPERLALRQVGETAAMA